MRTSLRRGGSAAALGLLLPLLAACASDSSALPAPVPRAEEDPGAPRPVAVSPDGRYRLLIEGMRLERGFWDPDMRILFVYALLDPPDPDTLVACEIPSRRVVMPDGRERSQDLPAKGILYPWHVDSAERRIVSLLDVAADATRVASLSFTLPILRVKSWESPTATVLAKDWAVDLDAFPFQLCMEPGPEVCRMTTTGGTPGLLDCIWAQGAVEMVDSRGVRLEVLQGSGGGEAYKCDFVRPGCGDAGGAAIAYPLEVRLRIPKEYGLERVPFEFRDLVLPPQPDSGLDRAWGARGAVSSAWSDHHDGLALRLSLPDRVLRGDLVEATLGASFDRRKSPPGAFSIDELGVPDRARLLLRNRDTGAALELRPQEGRERGEPPQAGEDGGEWPVRFALATIWDSLVPGTWEVRATLEVPPNADAPGAWSGTLTTEVLPLVVEEPPSSEAEPPSGSRRIRFLAPKSLRVRQGGTSGTVAIGYGPKEAEVVDIGPRNGFVLATAWGTVDRDFLRSVWPSNINDGAEIPEVLDTLDSTDAGPIDLTYEMEVYEAATADFVQRPSDPRQRRTLWKRSFRVTATASEIEALRR